MVRYDSRSISCKEPFGAIQTNQPCTMRVEISQSLEPQEVVLLLYRWGDWENAQEFPMQSMGEAEEYCRYQAVFSLSQPWTYFYCFRFASNDGVKYIKKGLDNQGFLTAGDGYHYQLTVYDAALQTPGGQGADICYNAWPDGFCRSDTPKHNVPGDRRMRERREEMPCHTMDYISRDFWGGDLKGIEQKLDYLQALGVTVLYLNPLYEACTNHRYNAANYLNIDPLLGDWQAAESLCREAKKRGIRIVFDGVFNHVGSDSIYFNRDGRYDTVGAYNSQQSPYYDWFHFSHFPEEYACWWGDKSLPALNKHNAEVKALICGEGGVLETYLRAGFSGVRLDVADELPDELLDDIRRTVKNINPNALVIGEVWEDATRKESYSIRRRYLLGAQLDGTMNYPYRDAMYSYLLTGDAAFFKETTLSIYENYPPCCLRNCWTIASGHDDARMISLLGLDGKVERGGDRSWELSHDPLTPEQYALGKKRAMVMAVIQYFLPGTPMLYYGNEAGVTGLFDPFNRKPYPWGQEDAELLRFYQRLGAVRRAHPMLRDAAYQVLFADSNVLLFERELGDKGILAAVNRTNDRQPLTLPQQYGNARLLFAIGDSGQHELSEYGAVVLERGEQSAEY